MYALTRTYSDLEFLECKLLEWSVAKLMQSNAEHRRTVGQATGDALK